MQGIVPAATDNCKEGLKVNCKKQPVIATLKCQNNYMLHARKMTFAHHQLAHKIVKQGDQRISFY